MSAHPLFAGSWMPLNSSFISEVHSHLPIHPHDLNAQSPEEGWEDRRQRLARVIDLPRLIASASLDGDVSWKERAFEVARDVLRCSKVSTLSGAQANPVGTQSSEYRELQAALTFGGRHLGVLQASGPIGRESFSAEDLFLLDAIASSIASGLENARLSFELRQIRRETAYAFVEAVEKKDRCTGGHAKRVAYYAARIAREMVPSLTEERIERITLAALLHDLGKIGIEDQILKKASALDERERLVMSTHPELGYHILCRMSVLGERVGEIIEGMRYHHERWDGSGYPAGLAGTHIPLVARIIAVADAYDAMVSSRPYRRGISHCLAIAEIQQGSGSQFDPEVVLAFARTFRGA